MLTRVMKCVAIVLLVLGFLWNLPATHLEWSVSNGGYMELFNMVVCLTAIFVVTEAVRTKRYIWAAGFVAIVILFNPVVPVTLSRKVFLALDSVCIVTFLISLATWKIQPKLSIPSITGRTPGSLSL